MKSNSLASRSLGDCVAAPRPRQSADATYCDPLGEKYRSFVVGSAGSPEAVAKAKCKATRPIELKWHDFMTRHQRAHLLTGEDDPHEELRELKRGRVNLMRGLARALCRRGNYAVTIIHDRSAGDLAMIGVEHREDAERICRAVKARQALPIGSWCSHRSFAMDGAAFGRIALALILNSPIAARQAFRPRRR
jgi:hypothetical protein